MTRRDIINWVKVNVYPQLNFMEEHDFHNIARMVADYRVGKSSTSEMTANVVNGFLFINSEPVGRIESYTNPAMNFDEISYYAEQHILARQGL